MFVESRRPCLPVLHEFGTILSTLIKIEVTFVDCYGLEIPFDVDLFTDRILVENRGVRDVEGFGTRPGGLKTLPVVSSVR